MNLSDLITRARLYQNLTPAERALLKLVEGFLAAGVAAALFAIADGIRSGNPNLPHDALVAGLVATLLAAAKYLKAQNDPSLNAAGAVAQAEAEQLAPAPTPPKP